MTECYGFQGSPLVAEEACLAGDGRSGCFPAATGVMTFASGLGFYSVPDSSSLGQSSKGVFCFFLVATPSCSHETFSIVGTGSGRFWIAGAVEAFRVGRASDATVGESGEWLFVELGRSTPVGDAFCIFA